MGDDSQQELPNILWEDERVENIVAGFYNNGTGILVATNKRLMFVDKGLFGGLKVEDFAYDKINSVQHQTGMLLGKITIYASGNKADIENVDENVDKDQARSFSDFLRARISTPTTHASVPRLPVEANTNDVISQLERLAKLKEQGILTEAEFEEQKRKILSG